MSRRPSLFFVVLLALLLAMLVGGKCSTGGGDSDCAGDCDPSGVFLTAAEVQEIAARAVAEAEANGELATIAVVDRVGNVLTVVRMPGAAETFTFDGGRGVMTGLDGVDGGVIFADLGVNVLSSAIAAISKAGTAAYLSSQGNAFTTRTASQIIQENFNPGELFQAGGPLFGVQFSQLPCGDFVRRAIAGDGTRGPKRMPVGFSADPGGLPLYKSGIPVGGVGVMVAVSYGLDADIFDFDTSIDERIATAATLAVTASFAAPANRRAERISVAGRTFRFADDENVESTAADGLAELPAGVGDEIADAPSVAVAGFFDNSGAPFLVGQALQTDGSGIQVETGMFTTAAGVPIPVEFLVDGSSTNLYPPSDSGSPSTGGGGLTSMEVTVLLEEALRVSDRARGQMRKPSSSKARVNFSIVDLDGTILGFIRSQDAPIFGADVSLQKARTAVFFSRTDAASNLSGAVTPVGIPVVVPPERFMSGSEYLFELVTFLGNPEALADGTAFSDRAGGNLSRPFFPDGINDTSAGNGPFSRPFDEWSPFSTGLQLDIAVDGILDALTGGSPTQCPASGTMDGIKNGFQIFPGSVPIYRGSQLIGGIGISGDGVDQDDMIAFLGLHNASTVRGLAINNAPTGIRADRIEVEIPNREAVNLRYVSCPPTPFRDSDEQNVCRGK